MELKAALQVADPNMAQILRMSQAFASKWGPHVERTAHLFLLFGGHCQAADKVDEHGGEAVSVDALIHPSHDMSKLEGVLLATYCGLKVRVAGQTWSSPECKTWLSFLTRDSFGRLDEDLLGPESNESVVTQNDCMPVNAWILYLVDSRGVFCTNEQPLNSLHHKVGAMKHTYKVIMAEREVTRLGAFGSDHYKALELYTTNKLALFRKHIVRSHAQTRKRLRDAGFEDGKGKPLAAKKGKWTTAADKSQLAKSEHYPKEFALAIANLTFDAIQRYGMKL